MLVVRLAPRQDVRGGDRTFARRAGVCAEYSCGAMAYG